MLGTSPHELTWLEVQCYFLFEPTWCVQRFPLLLGLQALQAQFGFILVILCLVVGRGNKDQALDNGSTKRQTWTKLEPGSKTKLQPEVLYLQQFSFKSQKSKAIYVLWRQESYFWWEQLSHICISICTIVQQQVKLFVSVAMVARRKSDMMFWETDGERDERSHIICSRWHAAQHRKPFYLHFPTCTIK